MQKEEVEEHGTRKRENIRAEGRERSRRKRRMK
jgi:hypothetical protein